MRHFYTEILMILTRTSFSESPLHLLTMLDAEMLKNVVLHSVATAFASIVFPVPVCFKRKTRYNIRIRLHIVACLTFNTNTDLEAHKAANPSMVKEFL